MKSHMFMKGTANVVRLFICLASIIINYNFLVEITIKHIVK